MVKAPSLLLSGLALLGAGCLNTDCPVWYLDLDGDGYTAEGSVRTCPQPDGGVPEASETTDCDDGDAGVHPGVAQDGLTSDGSASCDDVDQDCDGVADEDAPTADWYTDADGDGFGAGEAVPLSACGGDDTTGLVQDASDCDDADGAVYPGAFEICSDGLRQDCDEPAETGAACAISGAVDAADATRWPGALAAAAVGDLDGDGLKDLALGEPESGLVRVISGPADDTTGGVVAGDGDFGRSLAAGDFDGDGRVELAVGAPTAEGGDGLLTLLGGMGLDEVQGVIGAGTAAALGTALRATPSRTGADGLLATTAYDAEGTSYNSAWVISAPSSADSLSDAARISSYAVTDGWPAALAAATDGAEIAVGYTADAATSASLFSLPFTAGDAADASVPSATADLLGAAIALVDLDADDSWDLLVGAPGSGEVFWFPDLGDLDADDAAWTARADHAGSAVDVVGDMTGDGRPELVIGGDGVAWVLHGRQDGYQTGDLDDVADARVSGLSGYLSAVTDPGDLDGDGYDELLLTDDAGTTLLWGGP